MKLIFLKVIFRCNPATGKPIILPLVLNVGITISPAISGSLRIPKLTEVRLDGYVELSQTRRAHIILAMNRSEILSGFRLLVHRDGLCTGSDITLPQGTKW